MSNINPAWPAIEQLANDVKTGQKTAKQLVERSLQSINDAKDYQSIIVALETTARKKAAKIDQLVAAGKNPGRLAGVPFVAKDNFLVFGRDTTAASNMLRGFKAPYQATAINLLEAEGAICVAKANLDAYAHGSSTENSDFFTTKNPHDMARVPGGSSGGSAAAVALSIAPFALGTDTGGSIRLPAAFCGVVGYKPTYGLVSRSGVVAMASSTDVVGPITNTVEDAALVLDVMSGVDSLDSTTIKRDLAGYVLSKSSQKSGKSESESEKKIKVGIVKEYFGQGLDSEIEQVVRQAISNLDNQLVEVEEVSLPSLPLALACYYVLCPAEVSSNLSRYDGIRYGHTATDAQDLDQTYTLSRSSGFGAEAKRRIMIGTYVLSSGYYDAYYKQAQIVRTELIDEFKAAFKKYNFLVGPTAPSVAFKIGQNVDDPLQMYLTDIMTVAANLVGIPAISLPIGQSASLPVGLQIMADQGHDRSLLEFAHSIFDPNTSAKRSHA